MPETKYNYAQLFILYLALDLTLAQTHDHDIETPLYYLLDHCDLDHVLNLCSYSVPAALMNQQPDDHRRHRRSS